MHKLLLFHFVYAPTRLTRSRSLGPSRSRPLASARLRAPRPPWTRTCKNLQLKQIQTCLTRSEKLKKHGEITSSMVKLQYLVIQFIHISYAEHSRRHSTKKCFTLSMLKIEKSASSASNEALFEALQLVKTSPPHSFQSIFNSFLFRHSN